MRDGSVARLLAFSPAIDTELARWLLERAGIAYVERPSSPLRIALQAVWYRRTAPLLLVESQVIGGGRAIAAWVEDRTGLSRGKSISESKRLWTDYNGRLGLAVARFVYFHLLPQRQLGLPLLTAGLGPWDRSLTSLAYPLVWRLLWWALGLSANAKDEARRVIEGITDAVEDSLRDGRSYLDGAFSLADVLFATSAAPLCLLTGYGGDLPRLETVPEPLRASVLAYRERPAGQFVARLYAERIQLVAQTNDTPKAIDEDAPPR